MTRFQANLLLTVVALIWGSAFVAQNRGMADVGPLLFTGVRFLIGSLVVLPSENDAVLAFLRRSDEETVLVVANLAATARASRVQLPAELAGWVATDVFGGSSFPAVPADGLATYTLGSREFYWLDLAAP